MGASLSQDTAYLPDEVITTIEGATIEQALISRRATSFYKHSIPPSWSHGGRVRRGVFSLICGCRLHFRHLDEKERGGASLKL